MERKTHEEMVEDMIRDLSDAVNVMTVKEDGIARLIAERLQREHRTLQQSMVRVLAGALVHYADARSDGRNAAAVRMCGTIKETLEAETYSIDGEVHLPTI